MILALAQIHRAYVLAHAPTGDHRAGQFSGAFDVVVGAGADAPEQVFFGRAPGQQDGQLAVKVILGQGVMLLALEHMRTTQAAPARDDRHLVERVGSRREKCHRCMTSLMHGQAVFFLGLNCQRAHGAHHHLVAGLLKIGLGDRPGAASGCLDRGLVQQIFQIGA